MNSSGAMVQSALGLPAFDPKQTVRVAVDPRAKPPFEWRHGFRHEFGSVRAIEALASAAARRDKKKDKRRRVIQKAATVHAKNDNFNPVSIIPPPPKPSGQGSGIVLRFAAYHAQRDLARKQQADQDYFFHQATLARWAREEAFREAVLEGRDPYEHDEEVHEHGPDCGCGHDHDHVHAHHDAASSGFDGDHMALKPSQISPPVHAVEIDPPGEKINVRPEALATLAESCVAVIEPASANPDGFYAAGSDDKGNRLTAPVLVVSKDYVHPTFTKAEPTSVVAPEHIVIDRATPPEAAPVDGKRMANEAWLVTWMLANGRALELKTSERLKKMKSDTHSLRRGMGVKKDAIPSDEVRAIMAELGVGMPLNGA